MFTVNVYFNIKLEKINEFSQASMENALNSRKEMGVIRFDVLQQQDDSSKFLFVEVYNSTDDQIKHREMNHYKKWRQAIEDMLVEPYTFIKYNNIIPD